MLVMGLSLALIPVVLFPVLRRVDEVLATGYLIIRGAVEAATYVMIAIAWLQLVPLADTMSAGPGTASSPAGVRLGALVIDSDGASVVMSLVFCLGAALFYVLLFRSRIVPRWIASWGLMGIPFCAAAYLLVRYGAVGIDSSQGNLLCLPLRSACQRRTTLTSNRVAVGGKPVSNFAFATARRLPNRAIVVGNSNSGLVMVCCIVPDRKSLLSFQTLTRLSAF